jgi:hypothetical protein
MLYPIDKRIGFHVKNNIIYSSLDICNNLDINKDINSEEISFDIYKECKACKYKITLFISKNFSYYRESIKVNNENIIVSTYQGDLIVGYKNIFSNYKNFSILNFSSVIELEKKLKLHILFI